MLRFHFFTSLNCRWAVHYGFFANATALLLYILYARVSTLEKWHVALPGLKFHSCIVQTLVNFDLGCKSQMAWGFEVSSTAQDESTGQQDAFPPRGSPNRVDCFIYPCFTQSCAFYINKSIMLDSESTSMITLTFKFFCLF